MQRRTRTRHQRKPYSTTRRVHRRRGFSKRYNRAKHTRYKKRRRRKTRRGRQRRGGTGESINSKDVCKYDPLQAGNFEGVADFDFAPTTLIRKYHSDEYTNPDPTKPTHNCNVFRYKGKDFMGNTKWYMYRNPGKASDLGVLKCSKKSHSTRLSKACPSQEDALSEWADFDLAREQHLTVEKACKGRNPGDKCEFDVGYGGKIFDICHANGMCGGPRHSGASERYAAIEAKEAEALRNESMEVRQAAAAWRPGEEEAAAAEEAVERASAAAAAAARAAKAEERKAAEDRRHAYVNATAAKAKQKREERQARQEKALM